MSALDLVTDDTTHGRAANRATRTAACQHRTGYPANCRADGGVLVSRAHIRAARESTHRQHEYQGSRHRLHAVLQLLSVVGWGRRLVIQL